MRLNVAVTVTALPDRQTRVTRPSKERLCPVYYSANTEPPALGVNAAEYTHIYTQLAVPIA